MVSELCVSAFEDCIRLWSVKIPNSITHLNSYAFKGCTALKRVELGSNIEYFGQGVFQGCEVLQHVVIPPSVIDMGYQAFHGCSELKKMVFKDRYTVLTYNDTLANVHKDIEFIFEVMLMQASINIYFILPCLHNYYI